MSRARWYSGTRFESDAFSFTGLSPSLVSRSRAVQLTLCFVTLLTRSYNPSVQARWFGLFRFRSPLLTESRLMSFPPGTEMFQFPGFASYAYVFSARYPCGWVAPFGYPRINACSRLPVAFRSVPRPSSPPGAKASTECPYRARDQVCLAANHNPPCTGAIHTKTGRRRSPRITAGLLLSTHIPRL